MINASTQFYQQLRSLEIHPLEADLLREVVIMGKCVTRGAWGGGFLKQSCVLARIWQDDLHHVFENQYSISEHDIAILKCSDVSLHL